MSNDGKPPVDNRYKEAVANQKAGVKSGKKYRYTFIGVAQNGLKIIFPASGSDIKDATENAAKYCDENNITYSGRVASKRNAYDRAQEEKDANN